MKKLLLNRKRVFAFLLALCLGMGTAFASDFSAVCTTGQTLYYNIIDNTNHYVEITYPGRNFWEPWDGYIEPTGSITLPSSVTYNNVTYTVKAIGEYAFYECSGLTGSLTIPNTVITIGQGAFWSCSGFDGPLTISNSVTSIAPHAFNACEGFTGSLTIPNSVTTIGDYAFHSCSGLTGSLTIPNSITELPEGVFEACENLSGELILPTSLTTIGYAAFLYCRNFTGSLTIPNSVTTISADAFYQCYGLNGTLTIGTSVASIGSRAFYHCPFTHIDYNATNCADVDSDDKPFESCGGTLTIGDNVERIPNWMFFDCPGFTGDLIIPNSVTEIGDYAFYCCTGFDGSLAIGNSVNSIGDFAFGACTSFSSLTIGSSVAEIGDYVFAWCSGLTSMTVYGETPPVLSGNAFYDVSTTIPVYVPCVSLADYQMASGWNAFSNWQCNMCAPKSLPYAYGFEEADEMDCWTMEDCHASSGIYTQARHTGNYGFRFYFNTNPPQYLISPEFEGTSAMMVSFYYKNIDDDYPETFQVGYSTTTRLSTAFTWHDEVTVNDQNTWMLYEDYFPEGTKYVAIKLTSNDQFCLYLDDFSFTAAPSCNEPNNLMVDNITSNSAVLHWTGEQDSYNVRYRMVPSGSWTVETTMPNSFADGFEDGLDQWTLIDADGDGRNWDYGRISGGSPHGGSKMAYSFSWYGGSALYPDNYLVTPQVALGGTVTFWASACDPNDVAEHFGIAVSTDSNTNPNDFTMVQEWTMTAKGGGQGGSRGNRALGTWYQYTVDLSAYVGQTGYIALRHFNCSDQFALAIDDFSYSNGAPGFTLGGLNPTTTYEVQVQGICPNGLTEWSEPVTFTTAIPTFPYGDYLGTALYDVQTNSGARTWTHVWPDGKVNFAFMTASILGYNDRGTGIGTYDSATDVWIPSMGRVENERTGFGSIAQYGVNGIVVAAHTNTSNIYIIPDKDDIATGSAVKVGNLDSTHEPYWPNVMTSGANRDIIHVIAQGSDDFVVYYFRSRDGGQTWDRQNVILPYMGTDYCSDWMVNCYYWMETTDDNCLALVVNNPWSDGMVLYSYDDGDTWERKVFYKHPDPFGSFEDPFYYPRWTSCQWDSQHHLHVLYELGAVDSNEEYLDLGGVAYWNEIMPYNANGTTVSAFDGNLVPGQPFVLESAYLENDIDRSWWHYTDATHEMWPEYIGYLAPLTDDGDPEDPYQASEFNIENEDLGQHGYYRSGVCGFPVLCMVPNSNEMVAVWSALDENHTDVNGNYYYKIFASYSKNKGATWSPMVQLTKDFDNAEFVYNQAAVVGRKLVIATQTDGETGTYYNGYYGTDTDVYDSYYLGMVFDIDDLFDTSSPVQTIELSEGWNWVSTYIDLNEVNGIAMLEEALGDYGVTIALQDDYAVYVGDGLWIGLEDYELTNAEMVMIEVTEDCTITLEGPTADPSTVEITLNPGWTWFGFPADSELELADILVDPEPEFGDAIAAYYGGVQYLGEWDGDFDVLLPGQGYVYWNESNEVKVLTFQTGAKAKAVFLRGKPKE